MNRQKFRAIMAGLVLVGAGLVFALVQVLDSGEDTEHADMLVEFDDTGAPIPEEEQPSVGDVELRRTADDLSTRVEMHDLRPGGVYTFWFVVHQAEAVFPDDVFVNDGVGAVAGPDGTVEVTMSSQVGDTSITGFYVEGNGIIVFDSLHDALTSQVRVEVVYHGQADVAGVDLDAWMADYWTGDPDVCANPIGSLGSGDVPTHPYCPGYWAATFPSDVIDDLQVPSRAPTTVA